MCPKGVEEIAKAIEDGNHEKNASPKMITMGREMTNNNNTKKTRKPKVGHKQVWEENKTISPMYPAPISLQMISSWMQAQKMKTQWSMEVQKALLKWRNVEGKFQKVLADEGSSGQAASDGARFAADFDFAPRRKDCSGGGGILSPLVGFAV